MAYFGLNFGARATPFDLLKIMISHFDFDLSTPKTYYSLEKCLDFLYRAEISAIVAYFGLNLVAMATPFAPLKILIAYFVSADPENPINLAKYVSISCTELKSEQCWLILA